MPKFGKRSEENLATVDERLQRVLRRAISGENAPDFSVIAGHRGEEAQNKAFAESRSKLKFPESNHNKSPSRAVDILPYGGSLNPWEDIARFGMLVGWVLKCAELEGVRVRSGLDWRQNFRASVSSFTDGPHIELSEDEV